MTFMQYERPESVQRAGELLAGADGSALVLAGGTDLSVRWRQGERRPGLVVDIKRIAELKQVSWASDHTLSIGACVTMAQLGRDEQIRHQYPALSDGASAVGSLQIRYRATLGGNLCNGSPCMDTAPPLLVLNSQVELVGARGSRTLPLADFFQDVKQTALGSDELLTRLVVPGASRSLKTAFGKIKRVRGHDLALVNVAVAFDPTAHTLWAAVGSCGKTPILTPVVENVAHEKSGAPAAGEALAAKAMAAVHPIDDVRASAEYRRDMVGVLCRRLAVVVLAS